MARTLIGRAMSIAYPRAIQESDGTPFRRPAFTHDRKVYGKLPSDRFFWQNEDGDRFYFSTYDEAAQDLAVDIGMDNEEAREVIASGRAVA